MQLQHNKRKIFLLSDHPLSSSGVGTQARWIIQGLLQTGKYSFRCFGAAQKHSDYRTMVVNNDFIIVPTDGFGTPEMIRHVLVTEQPDAMLLFTDPRFFQHVWFMEDEIHQICPIVYNHIWDNFPIPTYNQYVYESCDQLNCINTVAYDIAMKFAPDRTMYIPHAVPNEVYFPLSDSERLMWKEKLLGFGKKDNFVALFVGRNARRKMVADIIHAWADFVQYMSNKQINPNKLTLLLHTDPLDPEGPNLYAVCEQYNVQNSVIFSKDRSEFQGMNAIYNISDVNISFSSAEGFGLPILEGKMTGLPAIAIKTGGLTRQVEDHIDGYQYGVALEPEVLSCVGNQAIPFIYESLCSTKTLTNALIKMYELPVEKKVELKEKCIAHTKRDYDINNMIVNWDKTLTNTINNWRSNYKSWECITI